MKVLILLFAILFVSCCTKGIGENKIYIQGIGSLGTVVIDSCEYLACKSVTENGYSVVSFSHKGNCRFCKERAKK